MKSEETLEEHMSRLGCFSPGEITALLKAEVNHDKIDGLARDKGVGLEPSAQVKALTEGEGFGDYLCPQCHVTHRAGSKVHKRHLKLLKEE